MPVHAVRALGLRATLPVARRADSLDVSVVLGRVAKVVVVLMTATTVRPLVAAVRARDRVWVRPVPSPHFDVDPLAGLQLVAVAWWCWSRSGLARDRIHAEWHVTPSVRSRVRP